MSRCQGNWQEKYHGGIPKSGRLAMISSHRYMEVTLSHMLSVSPAQVKLSVPPNSTSFSRSHTQSWPKSLNRGRNVMEGNSEVGDSGPKRLKSQCLIFANFTGTHHRQHMVYTLLDSSRTWRGAVHTRSPASSLSFTSFTASLPPHIHWCF